MWLIFIIIIIIFIYSGMTRRSNFPFQSVSETPFFLPLLQEKNKKKATTKRKTHINYN